MGGKTSLGKLREHMLKTTLPRAWVAPQRIYPPPPPELQHRLWSIPFNSRPNRMLSCFLLLEPKKARTCLCSVPCAFDPAVTFHFSWSSVNMTASPSPLKGCFAILAFIQLRVYYCPQLVGFELKWIRKYKHNELLVSGVAPMLIYNTNGFLFKSFKKESSKSTQDPFWQLSLKGILLLVSIFLKCFSFREHKLLTTHLVGGESPATYK